MTTNNQASSKLMLNNILIVIITLFMSFWLSACSVSSLPTVLEQDGNILSNIETNSQPPTTTIDPFEYEGCAYPPKEYIQACTAQSGQFSQQGMLGCYMCVVNYDDAGKSCKDSADCQGICESTSEFLAFGTANQTGQCASTNSPFGCHQPIEKGIVRNAFCAD